MQRHILFMLGMLLLGTAIACTQTTDNSGEPHPRTSDSGTFAGQYPLKIVCTTAQVADIARNVAGSHAEVFGIMGPGVDPHLYRARPSDMRQLNEADLIFFNGMHLEGRMADLLVKLARSRPTFAVTETLQAQNDPRLREPPEFAGHYDPHLWHSAALWADCVSEVARQLAAFDPDHADDYRANAEKYRQELLDLHAWAAAQLASVPADRRVLVTAHDAFGYFGQAYGVEVHGLQGISTQDEPSVATMDALVEMLTSRKIRAVFVESSVPQRTVQALIEACRSRGHEVSMGGELFSDAMGEADTPEATYTGMFQHNVNTVVEALK